MKPRNGEKVLDFLDRATKALQQQGYRTRNKVEVGLSIARGAQREALRINEVVSKLAEENGKLRFRVAKLEGQVSGLEERLNSSK